MAVIDLRGTNDELFRNLGQIMQGLLTSDEDRVRAEIMSTPGLEQQLASQGHEAAAEFKRMETAAGTPSDPITGEGGKAPVKTKAQPLSTSELILPTTPSGRTVPREILDEIMARNPDTPEMQLQRALAGLITPTEQAEVITAEIKTRGKVAEATGVEAERSTAILQALSDQDLTPDEEVRIRLEVLAHEAKQRRVEGKRLDLTEEQIQGYAGAVSRLTPLQRDMITLESADNTQAALNSIAAGEAFDRQKTIEEFRARVAAIRTPQEALDARLATSITIQERVDVIVELVRVAEDAEDMGLLRAYASQLNSLAGDLEFVDRRQQAIVGDLATGVIFRNKIKGLDFGTDEPLNRSSSRMLGIIDAVASEEMSPEILTFLDEFFTDEITNTVDQRRVDFVKEQAMARLGGEGTQEDVSVRAAKEAQRLASTTPLGDEYRLRTQAIEQMEQEYNLLFQGQDDFTIVRGIRIPDKVRGGFLLVEMEFLRLLNFLRRPATGEQIPGLNR